MTQSVIAQIGGLSQVGLATEATFGTFLTPYTLLPVEEATIDPDPGLFFIEPIAGYRDTQWFPMYGQYKFAGALGGALFPSNGSPLISSSIASDNQVAYGVTGSGATSPTTLNGATLAGATSVTLTSASGYTVGKIIQIDVNSVGSSTTAECRKITTVSTNTLTLDKALTYAHASGAATAVVVAPFAHTMNPSATLGSMSVSKRVGNTQAEEWAGCRVSKWAMKSQATNSAITYTADVVAQSVAVNDSPTFLGITDETPFQWVNMALDYNSLQLNQSNNLSLAIDNKLVEDYTFAQQHNVQFITPAGLLVSGSFEVIFNSLDDADYGYFQQILAQGKSPVSITMGAPNGVNLTMNLGQCSLKTYKDAIKVGETIKTSLAFEASVDLSATPIGTIQVSLSNSQYLPF